MTLTFNPKRQTEEQRGQRLDCGSSSDQGAGPSSSRGRQACRLWVGGLCDSRASDPDLRASELGQILLQETWGPVLASHVGRAPGAGAPGAPKTQRYPCGPHKRPHPRPAVHFLWQRQRRRPVSHLCASRSARTRPGGALGTPPRSRVPALRAPRQPSAGPPPCHHRLGSLCVRAERRGRAIGPPAQGASPFLARLMHMHEHRPLPAPLPRGRARRAAAVAPSPRGSPSASQGEPSLLPAGGGGAPAMSALSSLGPP